MFLLIDNYDSFTYNLVHYLQALGEHVIVKRNDSITVTECLALKPTGIVLSPGPCAPNEAGICLQLVTAAATAKIPLFGVCLGHQTIGQAFGGSVIRAPHPIHGKTSQMHHDNSALFQHIANPFTATRYHSLLVEKTTLPECLVCTATLAEDGNLIMALQHKTLPLYGVQFHPESIASESGHQLLQNFIALAKGIPAPIVSTDLKP